MAAVSTCISTSVPRAAVVLRKAPAVSSFSVPGLTLPCKGGRVRCSAETKKPRQDNDVTKLGAAAMIAAASWNPTAALALVDERLSTEGTGLPFGVSNNLLVWILGGVFALIWSFYIVYTSSLSEDEESGLSL